MKQLIIILSLMLTVGILKAQNAVQNKDGNYTAIKSGNVKEAAKTNGKTFTDTKGIVYPVYVSVNGKLFVIRTSKNGNQYKMYLKTK